jgi:hypothetical protein
VAYTVGFCSVCCPHCPVKVDALYRNREARRTRARPWAQIRYVAATAALNH